MDVSLTDGMLKACAQLNLAENDLSQALRNLRGPLPVVDAPMTDEPATLEALLAELLQRSIRVQSQAAEVRTRIGMPGVLGAAMDRHGSGKPRPMGRTPLGPRSEWCTGLDHPVEGKE